MLALLEHAVEHKEYLNTELLEAYSLFYKKDIRWLQSEHEGKTIQNLINDACDVLEQEGKDLDATTITEVLERIDSTINVTHYIPPGYLALEEAREKTKSFLEQIQQSGTDAEEVVNDFTNALYKIETEMKKITNDKYKRGS